MMELAEYPDHPFTLFNLGMTYRDAGQYDKAVDCLQRSIKRSGDGESQLRKAYALLVATYAQWGKPHDACAVCKRGLSLFPEDSELQFREAGLFHQFRRFQDAVSAYRRVLECNEAPHFASMDRGIRGYLTRHNLAVVYSDMGEWSKAEAEWWRVVADEPEFHPAWSGLAEALMRRGDLVGAADAWRRILAIKPIDACAHHNLGTACLTLRDWNSAISAFKEAVRIRPTNPVSWLQLGYALKEAGQIPEAVDAWKETIRLQPDNSDARRELQQAVLGG
jgi:tetratricopeptide (TPR) repeat protein